MERVPPATEIIPTTEQVEEIVDILAGFAVVNASVAVHLLDADPGPSPAVVWADLSEASYAGYTSKTATVASFTLQQTESDGSIRVQSTTLMTWAGPTSAGPVTIYGHAITESGGTTRLYRVERYAVPVVLPDDSRYLNVIPSLTFPAGVLLS